MRIDGGRGGGRAGPHGARISTAAPSPQVPDAGWTATVVRAPRATGLAPGPSAAVVVRETDGRSARARRDCREGERGRELFQETHDAILVSSSTEPPLLEDEQPLLLAVAPRSARAHP